MKCTKCDREGYLWEPMGGGPLRDHLCRWHGLVATATSVSTYINLVILGIFIAMGYGAYRLMRAFFG